MGAACGRSGARRATCSFVSGPQRYDIAHRVVRSLGADAFAETSRNCRLPSPPIARSSSATSVPPAAEAQAFEHAATSASVCSRPTVVPALAIAAIVQVDEGSRRGETEPGAAP